MLRQCGKVSLDLSVSDVIIGVRLVMRIPQRHRNNYNEYLQIHKQMLLCRKQTWQKVIDCIELNKGADNPLSGKYVNLNVYLMHKNERIGCDLYLLWLDKWI